MPDNTSKLNTPGTPPGRAPSAPITGASAPGTVGAGTQGQSTNVGQQIKAGLLTPVEAVRQFNQGLGQGRKFTVPSIESRTDSYGRACADREMFERNRQPFLFPGFTPEGDFYLSQGLTLIGACSGHSKSTTASSILAGFIKYKPDTLALVISNEESTDAIIHRTACVLLEKSYMKFHAGNMQAREAKEVRETAHEVLKRVVVVNDPAWDTTCIENVQTILDSATEQANLVLIDYFQTINHSRDFPDQERFQVLKRFGSFIRDYGRRSSVPVAVLCQLSPSSSAPEFQSRVQNDKTIYNDAFNVVEITPDFETKLTTFTIHKQRFGVSQGVKVILRFEQGRYLPEVGL